MITLKTVVVLAIITGNCVCDFIIDPLKCEVTFETESGLVCGRVRIADRGHKYASFRGVPYGKPPLGKLRFEELHDVEPWNGLLDAKEESPACPQKELIYGRMTENNIQSEDCIYLNLHVPLDVYLLQKTYPDCHRGLPILVMIHGGGFQVGSGSTDIHGPEYLIAKGVIVITFNYRINVFGFLSLGTEKIPGNQGLRDVIKLLKWVQRHACAFGGDPNSVTLMGQSSGASVAHLMTLSNAARGLFHKVILMSGTGIPNYFSTSPEFAKQIANDFLNYLGINSTDPDYVHYRLIKTDIKKLMLANAFVQYDYGLTSFVPVVEQKYPGVTRVLDADPLELIAKKRGFEYPMIVSYTNEEMQFFKWISYVLQLPQRIEKNPLMALPLRIANQTDAPVLVAKVIEKYFKDGFGLPNFLYYYNYLYFKYPALKLAEIRSLGGAPTYLYRFSYDIEKSSVSEGLWTPYKGAAHVDDLTMVFRVNSLLKDHGSLTVKDDLMKDWMTMFLTNFMRCSNPTCTCGKSLWPPLYPGKLEYQDIAIPMKFSMKPLDSDEKGNKIFLDGIDKELSKIEAELKNNKQYLYLDHFCV